MQMEEKCRTGHILVSCFQPAAFPSIVWVNLGVCHNSVPYNLAYVTASAPTSKQIKSSYTEKVTWA